MGGNLGDPSIFLIFTSEPWVLVIPKLAGTRPAVIAERPRFESWVCHRWCYNLGQNWLFSFFHYLGLWVAPHRAVEILESIIQISQYLWCTYCIPNSVLGVGDPATKTEETPTLMWFKF